MVTTTHTLLKIRPPGTSLPSPAPRSLPRAHFGQLLPWGGWSTGRAPHQQNHGCSGGGQSGRGRRSTEGGPRGGAHNPVFFVLPSSGVCSTFSGCVLGCFRLLGQGKIGHVEWSASFGRTRGATRTHQQTAKNEGRTPEQNQKKRNTHQQKARQNGKHPEEGRTGEGHLAPGTGIFSTFFSTQHLTNSSSEMVTVDLHLACTV